MAPFLRIFLPFLTLTGYHGVGEPIQLGLQAYILPNKMTKY